MGFLERLRPRDLGAGGGPLSKARRIWGPRVFLISRDNYKIDHESWDVTGLGWHWQ